MAIQNLTFTATGTWQSLGIQNKRVHIRNSSTSQAVYVCVQAAEPDDLNEGRELNTYSEERAEFDVPLAEDVWVRVKSGSNSVQVYVEVSEIPSTGSGSTDVSALSLEATQLLLLAQLQNIALLSRTQASYFATGANTLNQSIASFILAAHPSSVIANICSVSVSNNGATAATITSLAGTDSIPAGATYVDGNGINTLTSLVNITLGAVGNFTVRWSEYNA